MTFSTRKILSKESLLSKVSSYQIFRAYCKYFEQVGKAFKSEFRDEKSPSCRIEAIGGDLLYTDFGEGSYYAIEFVMRKFHCDFYDALSIISQDFGLDLIDLNTKNHTFKRNKIMKVTHTPKFRHKTTSNIEVHYRPWKQEDLDYWQQFGWTLGMLERASIRPIDYYWLTMEYKGIIKSPYSVTRELAYSYDYYRHNGIFRRKLYFPFRESRLKWLSNVDNTIIQNWDLLPKKGGELLFITSSKKDCGPIHRLYGGLNDSPYWNSIASNTESSFIPEIIFYKLKRRFEKIILWLDCDETGIKNMKKFSAIYNIPWMSNPLYCNCPKDQSDLWKEVGGTEFRRIMIQQMKELK